MSLSIIGPTLHDLSTVNGFNYEELSRVASMWSLGNLFGIILGTFFSSHFLDHSHRVIMVILVIIAGSASSIPFARNLPLLGTLWFVQGVSFGNSDVCEYNILHVGDFMLGGLQETLINLSTSISRKFVCWVQEFGLWWSKKEKKITRRNRF